MIIIYHTDLDGYCSAALLAMKFGDVEFIPWTYGQAFPWKKIEVEWSGHVYLVDLSLQPFEQMFRLNEMCKLHWIDHHKTALEGARETGFKARGAQVLVDGLAACELTWAYLYPDEEAPRWVRLLGRYDVWDHSDPNVLPFHYGMQLEESDPNRNMSIWRFLARREDSWTEVRNNGHIIGAYVEREYGEYASSFAFDVELDGLKFVAVNRGHTGSRIADSVFDWDKYDGVLTFAWARDKWTVGLYSDKPGVDVSGIAKKNGGGGHAGAAGFQCKVLPFELKG